MSYFPQSLNTMAVSNNPIKQANYIKSEKKIADAKIKAEKKAKLENYIKNIKDAVDLAIYLAVEVGKNGSLTKTVNGQVITLKKENLSEFKKQIFGKIRGLFAQFNEYKKKTGGSGGQNAPALFDLRLLNHYATTRAFPNAHDANCADLGAPLNNYLLFTQPIVLNSSGQQVANPVYGLFLQGSLMKLMALYLFAANNYQKTGSNFPVPAEMKANLAAIFDQIMVETANKTTVVKGKKGKNGAADTPSRVVDASFNTESFPVSHYPKINGAARLKEGTAEQKALVAQYVGAEKIRAALQQEVQLTKDEIASLNPAIVQTFRGTAYYGDKLTMNGVNESGYNMNGVSALQVMLDAQREIIGTTDLCIKKRYGLVKA